MNMETMPNVVNNMFTHKYDFNNETSTNTAVNQKLTHQQVIQKQETQSKFTKKIKQ